MRLNKKQIENKEYENYDPETYDFIWNDDYTECEIVPCNWYDEVSYLRYQGDYDSYEDSTEEDNLSFIEPENEYFSDTPF